jgi:protein-S-isoprenylcysteine O-methyltransferase Ste14
VNRAAASLGSVVFFFVAPVVVAGVIPWWITRWRMQPSFLDASAIKVVGAILVAFGLVIVADSFARFALEGIRTPAPPFPTRHLVVTGLYRRVRNPMYVAVVAMILGQALLSASLGLLVYGALTGFAPTCSWSATRSRRCGSNSDANTKSIAPTYRAGCRAFGHGARLDERFGGAGPS